MRGDGTRRASLERGACSLKYRISRNALDLAGLELVESAFPFDRPCPLRLGVQARLQTRDEPRGEPSSRSQQPTKERHDLLGRTRSLLQHLRDAAAENAAIFLVQVLGGEHDHREVSPLGARAQLQ